MSAKERRRLEVFSQVKAQGLPLTVAARQLGLSYRQTKRLGRRYREQGDAGLVHGLRGKPSNNQRWRADQRGQVLARCRQSYPGFGPTLASEYLARRDGLAVDHETLRRWLLDAGLWTGRTDRSRQHRRWRERRAHAGELVQMDGSDHDWFEGRAERCVLMVLVDDATGWTWGRFVAAETTEAAMRALRDYIRQRGLPQNLYVDRDSIYRVNRAATAQENLEHTGPLTQMARALRELEVGLICAHSPQAKGRVERMNGTLQDRLVKALRLEGIADVATANRFLEEGFWPEHNRRFAGVARAELDLHRPAPGEPELDRILCVQEVRTVGRDYCVRYQNRFWQLTGTDANRGLAGGRVTVCQHLDGRITLRWRGRELTGQALPQRPAAPPRPQPTLAQRVAQQAGPWKPPATHAWRQPLLAGAGAAAAAGGPLRSGRARSARPPCAPRPTRGKGTVLLESK